MIKRLMITVCLLFSLPGIAFCAKDKAIPWEIKANILSYDGENKVYSGKGDVILRKGNNYL